MELNKKHKVPKCGILIALGLLVTVVLLHQCECSHYKIGPSGELGEITILRDYVILGHHSFLFAPTSNYIRIPIEYDRSTLEIEVTEDSVIHIKGCPKIISYELSEFKGADTAIGFDPQKLRKRETIIRCLISTYGYGLYPTFYYRLPNSSIIIRQEYLQRFPFESPDKWCHYDTIR